MRSEVHVHMWILQDAPSVYRRHHSGWRFYASYAVFIQLWVEFYRAYLEYIIYDYLKLRKRTLAVLERLKRKMMVPGNIFVAPVYRTVCLLLENQPSASPARLAVLFASSALLANLLPSRPTV